MSDLVQRARLFAKWQHSVHGHRDPQLADNAFLMDQLCAEVERLRADEARLGEKIDEALIAMRELAPEIERLRAENQRLQSRVLGLTHERDNWLSTSELHASQLGQARELLRTATMQFRTEQFGMRTWQEIQMEVGWYFRAKGLLQDE